MDGNTQSATARGRSMSTLGSMFSCTFIAALTGRRTWCGSSGEGVPPDVLCAVYLRQRYEPYRRQQGVAERRLQEQSAQPIPEGFEFRVVGLSNEAAMALRRARPRTLGEARRVPGMTVSALAVLAAQLQRRAMRAID